MVATRSKTCAHLVMKYASVSWLKYVYKANHRLLARDILYLDLFKEIKSIPDLFTVHTL